MVDLVRLTPEWKGDTAIVVGNGFSALEAPLLDARDRPGFHVLVSNSGYETWPWAEQLMCADRHWLAAHPDLSGFTGRVIVVTQPQAVKRHDPRMIYMRRANVDQVRGDMFADTGRLVEGHTSASTNISSAVLRGVRRILLVGLDLAPGPDGRRSTYDGRRDAPERAKVRYDRQARQFAKQAEHVRAHGVEVINCSRPGRLNCYPMGKLEDYL